VSDNYITANELVLFATNTGPLLQTHLHLARTNGNWREHIVFTLLPLYRKEFHEPRAAMRRDNIITAASELSDYYIQYLSEL